MEMNTRIQVEHRVTELCYALQLHQSRRRRRTVSWWSRWWRRWCCWRAHKTRLPKPERVHRNNDCVEARLNATNQALHPHAGGIIATGANAIEGEIRDDQGISLHNPDTDVFMNYTLAGAYDSNIALLLTVGNDRLDSYQRLAEILRVTQLLGQGSRDQPRIPLRPGELVHRRQHQRAADHAFHPAVPHGGGATAREGRAHRPRSRAGAGAQALAGGA